jgi:hypothetical protein
MKSLRIIVADMLAPNAYGGMDWMHMQIAVGLRGLGYDAYYIEATSSWPYDPIRQARVDDSDYALQYEVVMTDYERQCSLARALAEEYFDARKVLRRVLARILS